MKLTVISSNHSSDRRDNNETTILKLRFSVEIVSPFRCKRLRSLYLRSSSLVFVSSHHSAAPIKYAFLSSNLLMRHAFIFNINRSCLRVICHRLETQCDAAQYIFAVAISLCYFCCSCCCCCITASISYRFVFIVGQYK